MAMYLVPTNPKEEQVSGGSYFRGIFLHQNLPIPFTFTFDFQPTRTTKRVRFWLNYPDVQLTDWISGAGPFTVPLTTLPATKADGVRISEYSVWGEVEGGGVPSCACLFTSGPAPAANTPVWCHPSPTLYEFEWGALPAQATPKAVKYTGVLPSWPVAVSYEPTPALAWDPATTPMDQIYVERMGPSVGAALAREFCQTASGHVTTAVVQDYAHFHRKSPMIRMTDGPMGHLGHAWVILREPEDTKGKAAWCLGVNGWWGVQHADFRRATMGGWHSPTATELPPAGAKTPFSQRPTRLPYYWEDAFKPGMLALEGNWTACTGPKTGLNKPWGIVLFPRDPGFGHACRGAICDTHNDRLVLYDHRPAHAPSGQMTLKDVMLPANTRPWGIVLWQGWLIWTCKNTHALMTMKADGTTAPVVIKKSARAWTYNDLAPGMTEDTYPHSQVIPSQMRTKLFTADGAVFAFPTHCQLNPEISDELWVMHEYAGWIWKATLAFMNGVPAVTKYVPGLVPWKDGAGDFREMAFSIGRIGARLVVGVTAWGAGTDHLYDATSGGWLNMILRSNQKSSADKFVTWGPMQWVRDPNYPCGIYVGNNVVELKPTGSTQGILRVRKRHTSDPVINREMYSRGAGIFKWYGLPLTYGDDCQGYFGWRPPGSELDALGLSSTDRAALDHYLDIVTRPNVTAEAPPDPTPVPPDPTPTPTPRPKVSVAVVSEGAVDVTVTKSP